MESLDDFACCCCSSNERVLFPLLTCLEVKVKDGISARMNVEKECLVVDERDGREWRECNDEPLKGER